MVCPKCGSENVVVQREQSFNVGGSRSTLKTSKKHGIIYWVLIGWWWKSLMFAFKMLAAMCTMGLSLLITRKKKKDHVDTISANKVFNKTVAVCQDCGNSWKVKV